MKYIPNLGAYGYVEPPKTEKVKKVDAYIVEGRLFLDKRDAENAAALSLFSNMIYQLIEDMCLHENTPCISVLHQIVLSGKAAQFIEAFQDFSEGYSKESE